MNNRQRQINKKTTPADLPAYPIRYNLWFSILTGLILLSFSLGLDSSPLRKLHNERNEYLYIADAITFGLGFSNAFGNCSLLEHQQLCPDPITSTSNIDEILVTPTAWMPPFFPALLAGIFLIFGHRTVEALFVMLTIKLLLFSGTAFALQKLFFRDRALILDRFVLTGLISILLYLHKGSILSQLHDTAIIAPLGVFITYFLIKGFTSRFSNADSYILGALAAVAALSTATLGYAFFLISTIGSLTGPKSNRFGFRVVLGTTVVALGLWCARNILVLGAPILNKSNLWYDFYQAQVLDDDGIVSYSTFQLFHPIVSPESHLDYIEKGEVQFMKSYQEKSIEYLKNNFDDYLLRSTRRLLNTLFIIPTLDTFNIVTEVPDEYLDQLVQDGIATFHPYASTYRWVNVHYPLIEREEVFARLFPPDIQDKLMGSLRYSKASYFYHRNKQISVWRRRLMGTLPTLCIIIGLFWGRIRRSPVFVVTLVMYGCYLGPYVLVSHYQRYQLGLMGLHTIFFMLTYLALRDRFGKSNVLNTAPENT